MGIEAWFTLVVVTLTLTALVRAWSSPPTAILTAITLLLASGVIDAEQALSGFANPAPFRVAVLYVLAAAVGKTGTVERMTSRSKRGAAAEVTGGSSPRC